MRFTLRPLLLVSALVLTGGGIAAGAVAVANAAGPAASGTTATFKHASKWGSGYVGEYSIVNNGTTTTNDWTVAFDLPAGTTLGNYWNAIVTSAGSHVVAKSTPWNSVLKAKESTTFGFMVNGSEAAPLNCTINGASCAGGTTPEPSKPPTSPTPSPSTSPQPPEPPKPPTGNGKSVFGPYIHMSVNGRPSLTQIAKDSGAKALSLAFVINQGGCDLRWDGVSPIDTYKAEITALKAAGVTPIVSTGGANGSEAAIGCRTADATAAQLEKVLALGVRYLDFDVEGGSVGDTEANIARGKAIAKLQAKYADLKVSFTLASIPTDKWGTPGGVMDKDLPPWKLAKDNGARIDRINIMTMNFGTYYDEGKGTTIMGLKSIDAAKELQKQIKAIHKVDDKTAWGMVGITPMIGVNDTTTEIFQLSNVDEVVNFAKTNGVGFLSFWSISRDKQCGAGTAQPSPVCSGVTQSNYQFSKRFAAVQ